MRFRKATLIVGLCAIAAGTLGAASASATTVEDAVTGLPLATGTTIANTTSDPTVLNMAALGSFTCTDTTMSLTTGTNHAAVMSGRLDSFTLTGCTDTIPLINYTGCHLVTPFPTVTVIGAGTTGGTITFQNMYLRCNVMGGTSGCYWLASSAAGSFPNATGTLAFSGVSTTHSVPAGGTGDLGPLCGSTGSLSMTLTHLVAPSLSNHTVRITG